MKGGAYLSHVMHESTWMLQFNTAGMCGMVSYRRSEQLFFLEESVAVR